MPEIKVWTSGQTWPERKISSWFCPAGRNLFSYHPVMTGVWPKAPWNTPLPHLYTLWNGNPRVTGCAGEDDCGNSAHGLIGWFLLRTCFELTTWPNSVTTIICKILTFTREGTWYRDWLPCVGGSGGGGCVYFFEDWTKEAKWLIQIIRSLFFSSFDFGDYDFCSKLKTGCLGYEKIKALIQNKRCQVWEERRRRAWVYVSEEELSGVL